MAYIGCVGSSSGGGGGSSYSETVLYTGNGTIPSTSFVLTDDYDKYDILIFNFIRNDAVFSDIVLCSFVTERLTIMGVCEVIFFGWDSEYSNLQISNDKKTINPGTSSMGSCGLYNIVGVKY